MEEGRAKERTPCSSDGFSLHSASWPRRRAPTTALYSLDVEVRDVLRCVSPAGQFLFSRHPVQGAAFGRDTSRDPVEELCDSTQYRALRAHFVLGPAYPRRETRLVLRDDDHELNCPVST